MTETQKRPRTIRRKVFIQKQVIPSLVSTDLDKIKQLKERIKWQKDKLAMMKDHKNADFTTNRILLTRVEANIDGLEWVLENIFRQKEVNSWKHE